MGWINHPISEFLLPGGLSRSWQANFFLYLATTPETRTKKTGDEHHSRGWDRNSCHIKCVRSTINVRAVGNSEVVRAHDRSQNFHAGANTVWVGDGEKVSDYTEIIKTTDLKSQAGYVP